MISHVTLTSLALAALAQAQTQALYGQCGGKGYSGPTACASGSTCTYQNPYYSQCLQGSGAGSGSGSGSSSGAGSSTSAPTTAPSAPASAPTTFSTSTSASANPSPSSSSSGSGNSSTTVGSSAGKVQFGGVNIAGCDFGCDTSGNCQSSDCPSSVGPTQMQHFSTDDHLNLFRLPVGWQYLVNNQLGGQLDSTFMTTYDALVQSCLGTGAHCIIDIHNYARWNGAIIGQGGPTNEQFASVWTQLATKYASSPNVIFGVMNEPHDLDVPTWATTVQAVVTAIRGAGASSQLILIPGTGYTGAGTWPSDGGPLLGVKNPDGSTTNLILDVHKYYDSDGSGTSTECVSDGVSDAWAPLATWLRQNKRQALVTETGGGNTASCEQDVCSALDYLNTNSDVYLGWSGWAAGNFATSYALSEVPTGSQDTPLVSQCIAGKFK